MRSRRLILVYLLFMASFKGYMQNTGVLQVVIHPYYGTEKLEMNKTYLNQSGDTLKIQAFKFYFSSLTLSSSKAGEFHEKNSYHLVDATEEETCTFSMKTVPVGTYDHFQFSIGVDSIKNVSGAFDGELDPAKGMYWAWNTGYIALKLEGTSPSCKTKDRAFEFHIGGYLSPFNTYRTSTIDLNDIRITANATTELHLKADVSLLFKARHLVSLKDMNHIVIPGVEAVQIAENYKEMISPLK